MKRLLSGIRFLTNLASRVAQKAGREVRLPSQRARMRKMTATTPPPERNRWFKPGIDPYDPDGLFACQRLRNANFIPYLDPGFRISRDDSLFAIGSCFARGIERALKNRRFDVVSAATDFDRFETKSDQQGTPLGFTNKYTTYSILNELSWALDPQAHFPEQSIVELADGTCIDPHINPTLRRVDRVGTLRRRGIMSEVTSRIKKCRVVFITLGLVETWYDMQTGVYLNSTPTAEMTKLFPGRYNFAVSRYPENLANMEKIYALLKLYGLPDLKIVVTVSPVPLMATYSGQDVVCANTYSKSTLRAVAEDWAALHSDVQYFPSYEMAMNSDRQLTWDRDMRHVRSWTANMIAEYFIAAFAREALDDAAPDMKVSLT